MTWISQNNGGFLYWLNRLLGDVDGEPLDPSTVTHNFGRMVKRAGLNARFHDLRHTYATLMLAAGVHAKKVSEALGHSTVAITLDIYSHRAPWALGGSCEAARLPAAGGGS